MNDKLTATAHLSADNMADYKKALEEGKPQEQTPKEKSPAAFLFENKDQLVAKYRQNVAYTGSYLSTSMAYAYAKGISDAIKLLIKENKDVEKTEAKAE